MKTFHHKNYLPFLQQPRDLDDGIHVDLEGSIFYVKDRYFHRTDGPAVIGAQNYYTAYYINGKRHRIDGPAIVRRPQDRVDWWFEGEFYSNINKWAKAVGIFETEEFVLLKLKYG